MLSLIDNNIWNYQIIIPINENNEIKNINYKLIKNYFSNFYNNEKLSIEIIYNYRIKNNLLELKHIFFWLNKYYNEFIYLMKNQNIKCHKEIKNLNIFHTKYENLFKYNQKINLIKLFLQNNILQTYFKKIKIKTIKLINLYLINSNSNIFKLIIKKQLNILIKFIFYFEFDYELYKFIINEFI